MSKTLTFDQFQAQARQTEQDEYNMPAVAYHALAMVGEAGEVANKVKKMFRDEGGGLTRERQAEICDELGDVLWYLAMIADWTGWDLNEVARRNLAKCAAKYPDRVSPPPVDVEPPMPGLLEGCHQ